MAEMSGLDPFVFLIVGLAAYRGTRALVVDTITQPFRDRVGTRFGDLVSCPHCAGFWLSILTLVVWLHAHALPHPDDMPEMWRWVVVAWAVAGAQSLLSSVAARLDET